MKKHFWLLCKKEILSSLQSKFVILFMMGFLILGLQWYLASVFFYNEASFKNLFAITPFLWILLLPILTLSFWSAEYKLKTIELLETLPVAWWQIVLAKFFASVLVMSLALLGFCFCFLAFATLGQFDWGVVFSSLFGVWILGLLSLSLCHTWSVLFPHTFITYLASSLSLLFFQFIAHPLITQNLSYTIRPVVETLSFEQNLNAFFTGIITVKTLVFYFVQIIILMGLICKKKSNTKFKIKIFALQIILFCVVFFIPHTWSLDLTQNQEHSLNHTTRDLVKNLQDQLTVKLYFSPNLPYDVQKIADLFEDQITNLKFHSHQNILIEKINLNSDLQKEVAKQAGITPLMLHLSEQNKKTTQEIFMGATVHYRDQVAVLSELTNPHKFEYNVALQLLKLQNKIFPKLGIVVNTKSQTDFSQALEIFKQLTNVVLISDQDHDLERLDLKALIVLDPVEMPTHFDEELNTLLNAKIPVIVFAQPSQINDEVTLKPRSTGLENFLLEHGVKITQELVVDDDQNALAIFDLGASPVEIPYPFWLKLYQNEISSAHPVTSGLTTLLFPWTHAVKFTDTFTQAASHTILLQSSPNGYLQEENNFSISPNYQNTLKDLPRVSAHPLAVEIHSSQDVAPLVVVSSNQFMRNNFLNTNYFREADANSTFLANLVEFVTWGQPLMALRTQGQPIPQLKTISPTQKQFIHFGLLALAVLWPLILWVVSTQFQKQKMQHVKKRLTDLTRDPS